MRSCVFDIIRAYFFSYKNIERYKYIIDRNFPRALHITPNNFAIIIIRISHAQTISSTSQRGEKGRHRAHIWFGIHGKMTVLESWYYNVNRISLVICGLWPYQNTKFRYIRAMSILGIFICFVVYQVHVNLIKRIYIFQSYDRIFLYLYILVQIIVYLRIQFQISFEDLFGYFSCYFVYTAIHRLFN